MSCLLFVLSLGSVGSAPAQPVTPFGGGQLQIQGTRLTLYESGQTKDADQTLNVGEPARVRTCFGGAACGTIGPGDPRVAGLKVKAELRGPELPQPVSYETVPGGTFVLPGFQREGDYFLENIRLVDGTSERVIGQAEPAVAVLHVAQILLGSATVTTLTLEDLKARGITLTQDNFKAFKFAVGFAFGTSNVQIELPVVYDGNGVVGPLGKPTITLDNPSAELAHTVSRWEPPSIVPFVLETTQSRLDIRDPDEEEEPEIPLFGALVIPGTISFLNQFFDARLLVVNGAPAGSAATLANVTGALRLPSGEALRLAGGVLPGQKLPVNEGAPIAAREQGIASWTVEGVRTGTHVLSIDILADLVRPGRDPLPLGGKTQAAVEVVDPRFNLTFNHPDTVREGEAYTLYVTVSNLSTVAQNLVTVDLASAGGLVGAAPAIPGDPLQQSIGTLAAGEGKTVEFKLRSLLTGKCFATTFQSDSSSVQGTVRLHAGVSEQGIPLSPATLLLPRFTNLLPEALVAANVRLLGLAYSLAVAPAGAGPAGLAHVVRADVERRAIDLGEAGQRLFLKDALLPSAEALLLDQLGNRHDLPEYDALRRFLDKGRLAAAALGKVLRDEQQAQSLPAVGLLDHLATTMSYARPFVAATLAPTGSPLPTLELRALSPTATTYLAYTTDEAQATPLRSLPFGEIYWISELPSGGVPVPLAVIGRLDPAVSYRVLLHAPATGTSAGRLVLIVPNEARDGFRRVDFGTVSMGPGDVYEVVAARASSEAPITTFRLVHAGTPTPVAGLQAGNDTSVALPPFRLIGAVQDTVLDRYGLGLSYLFNRPPDRTSAETASSYRVRSTFHGLDTTSSGQVLDGIADKSGVAAFLQPNSERVVNVRYSSPISPIDGTYGGSPVIRHEHRIDFGQLRDPRGIVLDSGLPPVDVEADHTGGLVDGKVLRGTGEPVAGARVQLIRTRLIGELPPILDLVAEVTTGTDGTFYFDFIEEPMPPQADGSRIAPGYALRAIVPAGSDPLLQPEEREEVSSIVRLGNRLAHVNIALLGRGTVTGHLLYQDDGSPVAGGSVSVASTLFSELKKVTVGADGSFRVAGVPVGPLTLTGRDPVGNRAYATVGLEQPGQTRDVTLRLPRSATPKTGTVVGQVLRQRLGQPTPPPQPAAGARVALYAAGARVEEQTTDASGTFRFEKVPEGQVTLQAADFSISRTPVVGDVTLAAGQTASLTLTLAEARARVVTGRVVFHEGATNTDIPVSGAVAFISGPGVFAYTDAAGYYTLENVPVQGVSDTTFELTAIDFTRQLQGKVPLPRIVDVADGTPPLVAGTITLQRMTGGIDGVVTDPFGNPAAHVGVVLYPLAETTTNGSGQFHFDDVPLGKHRLIAHAGDGLAPGKVGYFGALDGTEVVFGGHRPAAVIRMVGGGLVRLHTRTASSTGVLSPVTFTRTKYSDPQKDLGSETSQTTTDQDGRLEMAVPVGGFRAKAVHPFNGTKEVSGSITYPGQVLEYELVFDSASTVTGQVLDVDGVTPVPNVDVALSARGLLPQHQQTDGQGRFTYELIPVGGISVAAAGRVGAVDRVGRTDGSVGPGQTLDVKVVMRAQGTVKGRILEGGLPLPNAKYYVIESGYPNRRLPASGLYTADAGGSYEVPHLFAGLVTVVAQDPSQPERQGRATPEIAVDFSVVTAQDIVISAAVGSLAVTVRDPLTGLNVPDCQVSLSNGEMTVSGADGTVSFDALALLTYDVSAFHAPTGRGGVARNQRLQSDGQRLDVVVYLDTRGMITGTLYDDVARTRPIGGGAIQLTGQVNGRSWGTTFTALASTDASPGSVGRFSFDGLPAGQYALVGSIPSSNRRGSTETSLSATAPLVDLAIELEPVGDVSARVLEKLSAGMREIDPSTGTFSVRLTQPLGCTVYPPCSYDYTLLSPSVPSPQHLYTFPGVLTSRTIGLDVQETSGEQRKGVGITGGAGSTTTPYQVVLQPKGVLRITVQDAVGTPIAGANVTVSAGRYVFQTATDAVGKVNVDAVPAGDVVVSARTSNGLGGSTTKALTYDDDVIDILVSLAPAVSAHGIVYHPRPGDIPEGSTLVPEAGAVVELTDSGNRLHVVTTGADGTYRFDGLPIGTCAVKASNNVGDGLAKAHSSAVLSGPNGNDNELPAMALDAAPPRILSISPPPGAISVSRRSTVEIAFSEALDPAVLPVNAPTSSSFAVRAPSGALAAGTWTSLQDAQGRSVVRFAPSLDYGNQTTYSIVITGGTGGVRDLAQRPLSTSGDVGSSFTTSDSVGPQVAATVPDLSRPVPPDAVLRFDFNEVVVATAAQLDGDLLNDAGELYYKTTAGAWVRLSAGSLYLTRGGYSFALQLPAGVAPASDSGWRRVVVSGLKDVSGNPMVGYSRDFRLWDESPPVLAISYPSNAASGQLSSRTTYTLIPTLTDGGAPATDIDTVEYFLASASNPTQPATTPSYVATGGAFSFTFTPAYNGNGTDPVPFTVWVQAVDTSTNRSNVVQLPMQVVPNVPATIGAVSGAATAPVAGTFYAGSAVTGTVSGVSDADGAQVTLAIELRKENLANPNDPNDVVVAEQTRQLMRPANGWPDLPAQSFGVTLPLSLTEGVRLLLRARVTDSDGVVTQKESAIFAVADDATAPVVDQVVAHESTRSTPATTFFLGQKLVVDFRARDLETAVKTVSVGFDGVFPSQVTATLVDPVTRTYRSPELTVPGTGIPAGGLDVVVTPLALDYGGNSQTASLTLHVTPTNDPTKPTVTWLSPVEGGGWPAAYTSQSAPGVALLLRMQVSDRDRDTDGNDVPGTIVSLRLKGPADATGVLSTDWSPATLLSGSASSGLYELLWHVPNAVAAGTVLHFLAEATDAGGNVSTQSLDLTAVNARQVYEGATVSILDGQAVPGNEADPLFLLDGSTLSLYPQTSGPVRRFSSIVLYPGGAPSGSSVVPHPSVLTSPEVTSYGSTMRFYPLDLDVTSFLGVAHGSVVKARGLLGGTSTQSVSLPNETAAGPRAGGSHGGAGGAGNSGAAGGVTDSIRDPKLPGGGGGGNGSVAGGSGGGVVRILGSATVRLHGEIDVDGESRSNDLLGGGAGGAVRIVAQRIDGTGRVHVNGGSSSSPAQTGAGGGGRIAISTVEPSTGPLTIGLEALGGWNGPVPATATGIGGAGSIWIERRDAVGAPVDAGSLTVANRSGKPASTTPLPALSGLVNGVIADATIALVDVVAEKVTVNAPFVRGGVDGETLVAFLDDALPANQRTWLLPISVQERLTPASVRLTVPGSATALGEIQAALTAGKTVTVHARSPVASVTLAGAARLVLDDDLTIGTALNDRTSVTSGAESRLLLRAEQPQLTLSSTPPAGSVSQGTTLSVTWSGVDLLALSKVETTWSVAGVTNTTTYSNEPTTVTHGATPILLPLSPTQPAGPVTYKVKLTDLAGRARELTQAWTVVADTTAPVVGSIQLSPTPGPNDTYTGGDAVTITGTATDNIALAQITLTVDGVTTTSATSPISRVWTAPPVSADTTYEIVVTATDLAGNAGVSVKRSVTVKPNSNPNLPTVSITCPSNLSHLPSGYAGFTLQATATDDQGVVKVEFYAPGDSTPFSTKTTPPYVSASTQLPTVSQDTIYRYKARAYDAANNARETVVDVHVVPAVALSTTGANDWAALATQTAYLAGGTLSVDVPRTLAGLILLDGGTITHSAGGRLELTVTGSLEIQCGGSIQANAKGYTSATGYNGTAGLPGGLTAGSHVGVGGRWSSNAVGATYGSVYRPEELGGGGNGGERGGGAIQVEAGTLELTGSGTIAANGGITNNVGGAGGSVWLRLTNLTVAPGWSGVIEAHGGENATAGGATGGGGGAVALEYETLTGALPVARAYGGRVVTGNNGGNGGAGTVYVKRAGAAYGDLVVDNRGNTGQGTVLPPLGGGTVVGWNGSGLTTGLGAVPAYFRGHWVEVRDGDGVLKGSWRIGTEPASISGGTVTLLPNQAGEVINVGVGDVWQGVYRFDTVTVPNGELITSQDPIRIGVNGVVGLKGPTASGQYLELPWPIEATEVTIEGNVSVPSVTSTNLTVRDKGKLTQLLGSPAGLVLTTAGTLRLEGNGSIDVTARGYTSATGYNGTAGLPGSLTAGSHVGVGGRWSSNAVGATYGSVYRPEELGGGGNGGERGGGAIQVEAGTLELTGSGTIAANGGITNNVGGAGGSVWLRLTNLTVAPGWSGVIEAHGGENATAGGATGGGGGAVALEYETLTGALPVARAYGGRVVTGNNGGNGGAGTVYVRGPVPAVYGDLFVDNRGISGQATSLASLGNGTAAGQTVGATLDVAPRSPAAYFRGHYVEVKDSGGTLKGTWRIGTGDSAITGSLVTLVPNVVGESINLVPGDIWRGVYKFDNPITVRNGATLESSGDPRVSAPHAEDDGTIGSSASREGESSPVEEAPGDETVHAAPRAQFTCPSMGDAAVPGVDLYLELEVDPGSDGDNRSLSAVRIELFVDGATLPFATGTSNGGPFSSSVPVPTNLVDGDTLRLIARATDAAGRYTDTRFPLRVTTGVVFDGPGTLDLTALRQGDTLIVRSGEILATGDASLRRLVVLGGARLAAAPGTHPRLGAGDTLVGCGGELDLVSPETSVSPAPGAPGVIE